MVLLLLSLKKYLKIATSQGVDIDAKPCAVMLGKLADGAESHDLRCAEVVEVITDGEEIAA